jgi:hypothetical protein
MIERIAATFYDAICDAVTSEELAEIKRRNREDYQGQPCCATHDFVDANHYLIAAYEELTGCECEMNLHDMELMAKVFDYAHEHFFK